MLFIRILLKRNKSSLTSLGVVEPEPEGGGFKKTKLLSGEMKKNLGGGGEGCREQGGEGLGGKPEGGVGEPDSGAARPSSRCSRPLRGLRALPLTWPLPPLPVLSVKSATRNRFVCSHALGESQGQAAESVCIWVGAEHREKTPQEAKHDRSHNRAAEAAAQRPAGP